MRINIANRLVQLFTCAYLFYKMKRSDSDGNCYEMKRDVPRGTEVGRGVAKIFLRGKRGKGEASDSFGQGMIVERNIEQQE